MRGEEQTRFAGSAAETTQYNLSTCRTLAPWRAFSEIARERKSR